MIEKYLERNAPEYVVTILQMAAAFGAQYSEQIAKSSNAKRETKLMIAVDSARRYAQRYGLEFSNEELIEAIEAFLGEAGDWAGSFLHDAFVEDIPA